MLESSAIPKLMFDCRTDNDVLIHTAGVRLAGVIDLQLLFLVTRTKARDRKKVASLARVILYAGGLTSTDKNKWRYDMNWVQSAMMIGPEEEEWAARRVEETECRLTMADEEIFEHRLTVLQAAPPGWDKVEQIDRTEGLSEVAEAADGEDVA